MKFDIYSYFNHDNTREHLLYLKSSYGNQFMKFTVPEIAQAIMITTSELIEIVEESNATVRHDKIICRDENDISIIIEKLQHFIVMSKLMKV